MSQPRDKKTARCSGLITKLIVKGRKERCTPLAKRTVVVLKAWINEQGDDESQFLSRAAVAAV